jgi:hypothetical protein
MLMEHALQVCKKKGQNHLKDDATTLSWNIVHQTPSDVAPLPRKEHLFSVLFFYRGVQWNSPKNVAKPGGTGWTPQPMAATTGAGYRPMVRPLMLSQYHCNTLLLVLVH